MQNIFFRYSLLALTVITLSACQTTDSLTEYLGSINYKFWESEATPTSSTASVESDTPQEEISTISMPGMPVETVESTPVIDTCYPVSKIEELSHITKTEPAAHIQITDIDYDCKIKEKSVIYDIDITFEGTSTAPEQDNVATSYPYFIAITTPQGNIIAKHLYELEIKRSNKISWKQKEDIRQIIPISHPDEVINEILLGFQLTPEQLSLNQQKNLHAKEIADKKIAEE